MGGVGVGNEYEIVQYLTKVIIERFGCLIFATSSILLALPKGEHLFWTVFFTSVKENNRQTFIFLTIIKKLCRNLHLSPQRLVIVGKKSWVKYLRSVKGKIGAWSHMGQCPILVVSPHSVQFECSGQLHRSPNMLN